VNKDKKLKIFAYFIIGFGVLELILYPSILDSIFGTDVSGDSWWICWILGTMILVKIKYANKAQEEIDNLPSDESVLFKHIGWNYAFVVTNKSVIIYTFNLDKTKILENYDGLIGDEMLKLSHDNVETFRGVRAKDFGKEFIVRKFVKAYRGIEIKQKDGTSGILFIGKDKSTLEILNFISNSDILKGKLISQN
jgi:hypothetical protein